MRLILITAAFLSLTSCATDVKYEVTKESHAVIGHKRVRPNGVHDEMSPKTMLFLDNGDSVKVLTTTRIPDTVWYEFRRVIKD